MTLGNYTFDADPATIIADGEFSQAGDLGLVPVNFDHTDIATSPTTMMSFSFGLDNSAAIGLWNLEVTEVPEIPATRLFGLGGASYYSRSNGGDYFKSGSETE